VAASEAASSILDALRPRRELVLENAMLRHQINILRRKRLHPKLTTTDRFRLVLSAALIPSWRRALAVVQPDTLLRWHRQGFRLFWRWRSASPPRRRHVPEDTVSLIRSMARENRLWGAERIRGEMLKLAIRVSKRSIQKYIRSVRRRPGGQSWATFVQNHAAAIWACDFVQTYDLLFRPLFLFFVVNQGSRRVIHVAATRSPTQQWTTQQIRNATMENAALRFLIRDRDDKYGAPFDRAARGAGIRVIKTAVRAPNMNPIAERFVGSLRRELLDHAMILDERHLDRVPRLRSLLSTPRDLTRASASKSLTVRCHHLLPVRLSCVPLSAASTTTIGGQRDHIGFWRMAKVASTGQRLLPRRRRGGWTGG
jgi:transposase InsO family protein